MRFGEAMSELIQVILDKMNSASAAAAAPPGLDGMRAERERLQTMLSHLQATLRDADQRVVEAQSAALWLGELQDLADDVEYLLDEFEYEDLRRRAEEQSGGGIGAENASGVDGSMLPLLTQVRKFLSSLRPRRGSLPEVMAGRVSDVGRRFDKIAEDRRALKMFDDLGERVGEIELGRNTRETSSFPSAPEMLGRDRVKNEIIDFLLESSPDLSVLAIVGMGGLGKTILAQFVYNDEKVGDHFHQKIWVHLSCDFDVKRIVRQILEHVADPQLMLRDIDNMNVLQLKLSETLRGKRFLLVLDDVWHEDGRNKNLNEWQQLCAPLSCGGKGSRILLTTRNIKAADVPRPVKKINLESLTFEDSWSLFKKHAFPDGNSEKYPMLEDIGRGVVRKLNGVPLAVTTIGSALHSEFEEKEWRSILETELWELEQGVDDILPALRVSYDHLPLHLKQCFAYCSVFPKGTEFGELTLVQLWMAMGYIQFQGRKQMEDVGIHYLHDLVGRSLIQLVNGRYIIHDLLHDLGRQVLQHDSCTIEGDQLHKITAENHCHHLSLLYKQLDSVESEKWCNYAKVRTLRVIFYCKLKFLVPTGLFINLVCLRVLDLGFGNIETLPDSIGNLRHLRYLDLRGTPIRCLPESLCCLYMLQTLNLQGCDQLGTVPKGMSNLTSLRHLVVKHEVVSGIFGIGKLTSLQELEVFSISKGNGIKIEDLKDMNELQGKLCIQNLQRVGGKQEASQANLSSKKYITQLEIEWNLMEMTLVEWSWTDGWIVSQNNELAEEVLDALVPPPNLKELTIKWYDGKKTPCWMDQLSLSALESICLMGCRRWDSLPSWLGQLSFLKSLDISGLPELKELPPLPSTLVSIRLGFLGLNDLLCLQELSQLQVLLIANLSELRDLPPLPTTLRILGMENMGIKALPEFCKCDAALTSDGVNNKKPSLINLTINGCPNLTSLREGILDHHLPELRELIIMYCEELTCWPEEEGFQATLLSLQDVLIIENCPKLMALPEGTVISPSLMTLIVNGCCAIPDESLFCHLHNLRNTTSVRGKIYVETEYPNLMCCSREALQHLRAVDWLLIQCIDQNNDEPPSVSLVYEVIWLGRAGNVSLVPYRKVSIKIRRKRLDYGTDDHTTLSTCLQHHHLCSSLLVLQIDGFPFQAYLLSRQGREGFFPPHLVSLEELLISDCIDMRRLPVETLLSHLMPLKKLSIICCPELTWPSVEEGIRSLPSLQILRLIRCDNLLLLDPSSDGSTNEMSVEPSFSSAPAVSQMSRLPPPPCHALMTDEPGLLAHRQFAHSLLSPLHDLIIWHSNLVSFTAAEEEAMGFLRGLTLVDCPNLQQLPRDFARLAPSLEALSIRHCPNLRCVPAAGLPASLEALVLDGSPPLGEEDWHKVAHVRLIYIDGKMVQGTYTHFQELVEKGKIFISDLRDS